MVLVYANFLSSVQNSQQSANSQLQAAMKLEPNWCDRCVSGLLACLRAFACLQCSSRLVTLLVLFVNWFDVPESSAALQQLALKQCHSTQQIEHTAKPTVGLD